VSAALLKTLSHRTRRTALLAATALMLAGTIGSHAAAAQPLAPKMPANFKKKGEFPQVTLTVNGIKIAAEVAATQPDREQGLMFRSSLGKNEGMLFIFDEIAYHCFWMKNTEIPLSIAYITDNGTITDIQEMAAETEDNHCPTQSGKYAIEMAKGWFSANGIKAGMQMQGLPR
jgi:uncharacterized protein